MNFVKRLRSAVQLRLLLLALVLTVLLSACSMSYYTQAVAGHLSLISNKQPIEDWLAAHNIDASGETSQIRHKLELAQSIRYFAEEVMGLPVGRAYSDYVQLEDRYVVWNVFAAEEFSVNPHSWCYPIIGCAHYRGYFKEAAANRYASKLNDKGLETYVGGVQAYSTLGWFADPILSSFVARSDAQFASLLFHEIAHRIAYAKNDTAFNESFATAIERFALKHWLNHHYGNAASDMLADYHARRSGRQRFITLVLDYRKALETLYLNKTIAVETMRTEKKKLFASLRKQLESLDDELPYPSYYGRWAKDINNAKLIPVNSYNKWVPALSYRLESVLAVNQCDSRLHGLNDTERCMDGLKEFFLEIKQAAKRNYKERQVLLEEWDRETRTQQRKESIVTTQ